MKTRLGMIEFFFGPAVRSIKQIIEVSGDIRRTAILNEEINAVYGGLLVGTSVDIINNGEISLNAQGSIAALASSTQYSAT